MSERRIFREAFILSTLGHLVFFSIFTLIEPEPIEAQSIVPYSVIALGEWTEIAHGDPTLDEGLVDPDLVRVAPPPRATEPKISLEHKTFIWDEEPPALPAAFAFDRAYWRFAKRMAGWLGGDLASGLGWPGFRETEVEADLVAAWEAVASEPPGAPRVRLRGGIEARAMVRVPVDSIAACAEKMAGPAKVVVRLGVDPDGNVRSVILERPSGSRALDGAVVEALVYWKFGPVPPGDEARRLQWGWVQITTGAAAGREPAEPAAAQAGAEAP